MNSSGTLRVALFGATGFIGSNLAAAAPEHWQLSQNSTPRLSTSATTPESLLAGAQAHPTLATLAGELDGIDVVINAAGMASPDALGDETLLGANALLPAVIALASSHAGVKSLIHLSSAAVQGNVAELDESATVHPFSPYSRSKALGEQVLALIAANSTTRITSIRATSVQGAQRERTKTLQRIAASPLASVAGSGLSPTVVSSVAGLRKFVYYVAEAEAVPGIVLQPWEGVSCAEVLRAAGGKEPAHLLPSLTRVVLLLGRLASRLVGGRLDGPLRRVELMWYGQAQAPGWADEQGFVPQRQVLQVLRS